MKKIMFMISCAMISLFTATSCVVSSCVNISEEKRLPLMENEINIEAPFSSINNNTVIDIEFSQSGDTSIELQCPQGYEEYVDIMVSGETLVVKLADNIDNKTKEKANRQLKHSKLYVSTNSLKKILINGSSKFYVNGDLRTEALSTTLNGSGDIIFNGIQCKPDLTITLNGSGDIQFNREAKAKDININLNGSGDIKCVILTAENVNTGINGSGDIDINEIVSLNSSFSINGSGDLDADNVLSNEVLATLTGSGDIKISGKCEKATFNLTNSGDIRAKGLEAMKVKSSIIGSGEIECYAYSELSAEVTGSGAVKYHGNPKINSSAKKGQVIKID